MAALAHDMENEIRRMVLGAEQIHPIFHFRAAWRPS